MNESKRMSDELLERLDAVPPSERGPGWEKWRAAIVRGQGLKPTEIRLQIVLLGNRPAAGKEE